MTSTIIAAVIVISALVLGAFSGYLAASLGARRRLRAADERGRRIREDAAAEGRAVQGEAAARAQAQAEVLRTERQREVDRAEAEERQLTQRMERKAARLERRASELETRASVLEERDLALAAAKEASREVRQQADRQRAHYRAALETRAAVTAEALQEQLVGQLVEDERSRAADRLRNLAAAGGEEIARHARKIMLVAMERYGGDCPRDRGSSLVPLPKELAEVDPHELSRAFQELERVTEVGLSFVDDENPSLRLDSADGVARELCRRVIGKLTSPSLLGRLASVAGNCRKEVDEEIEKAGGQIFKLARLKPPAAEIRALMGRLTFRTSYTQNQWRHSLEAARLAGLMAAELGLDPELARRGALLHDMGKSLSHEREGSHALIGGEIALRNGEGELVANAIAYHHGEQASVSAYAPLVAAADAMSGGRPGARREAADSYGERIGELERVARNASQGVASAVHAVQAGRELRIYVKEERATDEDLDRIASAVAKRISEELTFPGQIRVTVIRMFCAVSYAA